MEFPASLSRQLSDLTDALDAPGTDLQAILAVLIDDVTAAVPSFLGLTMTLRLAGEPITLHAIEPITVRAARSSLQLPLDPLAGAGPGSVAVFYAGDADAFAVLAVDIRRLYGLDGEVLLDRHLPGPGTDPPGVIDPAQATAIHRAIGFLIGRGLPPEDAARELDRRAAVAGRTLLAASHDLLNAKDTRATAGTADGIDPAP